MSINIHQAAKGVGAGQIPGGKLVNLFFANPLSRDYSKVKIQAIRLDPNPKGWGHSKYHLHFEHTTLCSRRSTEFQCVRFLDPTMFVRPRTPVVRYIQPERLILG